MHSYQERFCMFSKNEKVIDSLFTFLSKYSKKVTDKTKKKKGGGKKTQKTRRKGVYRPSEMVTGEKRHVYLEYTKGNSNKFWEAELSKKKDKVFLSWGRIGGPTQSKTQHLGRSTPFKNILAFNKLVQSKLKKGYVRGGIDTRPNAGRG